MSQIITIGKRLTPKEHIAFVEPFDPSVQTDFHPARDYKARVILLNRDSILTEASVEAFAEVNGLALLDKDRVAANPGIRFRVETFEPAEDFKPSMPFVTRILWRDLDGNEQSKLLLTDPETVMATLVIGDARPSSGVAVVARKQGGNRRSRREKTSAASVPHP